VTCPIPDEVALQVISLDGDHPFSEGTNIDSRTGTWRRAMMRLFKSAGVDGHPHMLRHTFAKRHLIAGVPIRTVVILMGHRKVAITEKHYSRWIPGRQAAVNALVRESWGKKSATPKAHTR
jgi:integrase